jgi:hypothetical protein
MKWYPESIMKFDGSRHTDAEVVGSHSPMLHHPLI